MNPLDVLIENAGQIYLGGQRTCAPEQCIGIIGDSVCTIVPKHGLQEAGFDVSPNTQVIDARGGLITPGLIDPHTHIVFAGDRSREYAMRAAGRDYLDIAQAGGGIASTMRATRAASEEQLVSLALPRLRRLLAAGVTTAEVKSGYGLDLESELKILRVVRKLNALQPIELVPTFLGAHTIPPEFKNDRHAYIRTVIELMLPAVASERLAEFCDVFVEQGAFNIEEARLILRAGKELGLIPKLHADQLSAGRGAELAAEVGAISADHLEYISDSGITALAKHDVVAVLLPGASLFLGSNDDAPARRLINNGVKVALATDCNPGTCMTENLQLMLTLGMSRLKMSPSEVIDAVTCHAAQAINRSATHGKISMDAQADITIFDVPNLESLPYHFGTVRTAKVIKKGQLVFENSSSH